MIVFTAKASEKKLKRLLKDQDNTFGVMGSGGYKIKEETPKEGFTVFTFTQCDCEPASKFNVALKNNQIWAEKVAGEISKILQKAKIRFSVNYAQKPPINI